MFDQSFETFRKATESSLQLQQDLFKYWVQQWMTPPSNMGASADWARTIQKRWIDLTLGSLGKQRETFESARKAGLELIEQTFRSTEAKSPEDYRRVSEELWRKLMEVIKTQSESQLREFLNWTTSSVNMAQDMASH
jgi:hypothetical protein